MDKDFTKLMLAMITLAETAAEQTMDYSHQMKDTVTENQSQEMRDDLIKLRTKLEAPNFDGTLEYNDYFLLIIVAYIAANNVRDRIAKMRVALKGYEETVIPKLRRIVDETHTAEDANQLAQEILILESNK